MNTQVFIYGLKDPISNQIRYIGKTNNPQKRISDHVTEKKLSHKNSWIKSLLQRGMRPEIVIIG